MTEREELFDLGGTSPHRPRFAWPEEEEVECHFPAQERDVKPSWKASLNTALFKALECLEERQREFARVAELTERVRMLEVQVKTLSKNGSIIAPIITFAPEPFDLLEEIKVVIQPSGDDFLATFFDANVNATGCNETDAVDNLKEMLLSRFEYLDSLPPEKLGPGPAKQIAVLRTFIRRKI